MFERSACPKNCPAAESVDAFSRWLARPIRRATDYAGGATWNEIAEHAFNKAKYWHQHRPHWPLVLAIALLPSDGASSLERGAAGDYDAHFRSIARSIVAAGAADAEIRLGWEFNGNWFAWHAASDPKSFVMFWRRSVVAMRAVPGARFTFNWNLSLGGHAIASDQVYPGDAYVDVIGLDFYNAGSPDERPDKRWQGYVSSPYGLDWLATFASNHRKPLTVPEWGTGQRADARSGGGDDPQFIERSVLWFDRHNVRYACYFDVDQLGSLQTRISDNSKPHSAQALRRLFGGVPFAPGDQ